MESGLTAGEKMLDASSTSNDRKYMILVSDAMTYLWSQDGQNYGVNFETEGGIMPASNSSWEMITGSSTYIPENWGTFLSDAEKLMENTIQEKASVYVRGADISKDPYVSLSEKSEYDTTTEIALIKAKTVYDSIASKYNAYAVYAAEDLVTNNFPYGQSFMEYLNGGKALDFSDIQNDINYLLDENSTVKDYMGYTSGDNGYNFDFVNDASQLSVKVGEKVYPAEVIGENQYGFGSLGDDVYLYELTYYPGTLTDDEYFVWTINTQVSNFEATQLIYSVKLTNPQTTPGTYGQYDADGSQGFDGLYTNNEARLDWVTTDGNKGTDYFAKPTVSYTIAPAEEPTEEPTQDTTGTTQASASPTTGVESNNTITWVLVIAGAAAVVLAAAVMNKRRSRG